LSEEAFSHNPSPQWIHGLENLSSFGLWWKGVMELVDDKWMKNMTPFSLFLALGVSQLLLLLLL
jgi:hypothetical protein